MINHQLQPPARHDWTLFLVKSSPNAVYAHKIGVHAVNDTIVLPEQLLSAEDLRDPTTAPSEGRNSDGSNLADSTKCCIWRQTTENYSNIIPSRPIKAGMSLQINSELVSTHSFTFTFKMISKIYLYLVVALLALFTLTTTAAPHVGKRERQELDTHGWLKASSGFVDPQSLPIPVSKPNRQFKRERNFGRDLVARGFPGSGNNLGQIYQRAHELPIHTPIPTTTRRPLPETPTATATATATTRRPLPPTPTVTPVPPVPDMLIIPPAGQRPAQRPGGPRAPRRATAPQ